MDYNDNAYSNDSGIDNSNDSDDGNNNNRNNPFAIAIMIK